MRKSLTAPIFSIFLLYIFHSTYASNPLEMAKSIVKNNTKFACSYFSNHENIETKNKIINFSLEKSGLQIQKLFFVETDIQKKEIYGQILGCLLLRKENHLDYLRLFKDLILNVINKDCSSLKAQNQCTQYIHNSLIDPLNLMGIDLEQLISPIQLNSHKIQKKYQYTSMPSSKKLMEKDLGEIYESILDKGLIKFSMMHQTQEKDKSIESAEFKLFFFNTKGDSSGYAELSLGHKGSIPVLDIKMVYLNDLSIRGSGFAAKFMLANIETLQRFSLHLKAQIQLDAWSGSEHGLGQLYGGYIWAPYGFDHMPNPFDPNKSKQVELNNKFIVWIKSWYGPNRNITQLKHILSKDPYDLFSPEVFLTELTTIEFELIEKLVLTWKYPWEMAFFDTHSVIGRPIGKFFGKLGKEFMTDSNEKVRWMGYLEVNQENNPGTRQFYKYVNEVLSNTKK